MDAFQLQILQNLYEGVYFVDESRTITFWNQAAESITGFKAEEVVGSRCMDDILNHVDEKGNRLCTGMCPLSHTLEDGKPREETLYLHHKEGHRVAVETRVVPIRDTDGRLQGAAEIFVECIPTLARPRRVRDLEKGQPLPDRETESVESENLFQPLGKSLYALQARFDQAKKSGRPFGLLLIDVDRLAEINQERGNSAGDRVMQMTAASLLNALRPYDFLCALGTPDFAALILDATREQTKRVAERARVLVSHSCLFRGEDPLRITVSIGAAVSESKDTLDDLMERARGHLKLSKDHGRNRTTVGAELSVRG